MKKCIVNGKLILRDKIVEKNLFIVDDKISEISDRKPTDEETFSIALAISSTGIVIVVGKKEVTPVFNVAFIYWIFKR